MFSPLPLDREGPKFVAIFLGITLIFFMFSTILGMIGLGLSIWCYAFFRDPERTTPLNPAALVSPADGVVLSIQKVIPPQEIGMGEKEMTRISVFMNVFNVHVNRVPASGTILKKVYYPGKFFNASLDKASEFNERLLIKMKTNQGDDVAFVQIAGLIARRIRCDVLESQLVDVGERFGMIRFGSRVDLYVPAGYGIQALEGQTTIAGETILAVKGAQNVKAVPKESETTPMKKAATIASKEKVAPAATKTTTKKAAPSKPASKKAAPTKVSPAKKTTPSKKPAKK